MLVCSSPWLPPFFVRSWLLLVLVSAAVAQSSPPPTAVAPAERAAVTRAIQRRAIVEGLSEPVGNLRITDLNGRDISVEVDARSEGGKVSLNLAQPAAVVLKSKTLQTLAAPRSGKIILPGGALVPLPAVGESAVNKAIWFRLTLAASPMPAPWDEKEGSYLTRLTFGLKRPDGAPPTLALEQPVIIKLAYQGLVGAEIAMISLEAAGLENEKTVALRFTPQSDKPTLLVRSTISDVNVELAALPRLSIQADRSNVLGLGLDVVTVNVTNVQPDGRSTPVEHDTPVSITIEGRARIDAAGPIVFRAGEATTRFTLRSSGLGTITIRANANGITGATLLQQSFPTGPLVAALIGGALGGVARCFMKGARRSSNRRRVIEGIIVASIVFVAGILGVGYLNLPAAIVATEAGAFLTGALGGFAGVSAFELLARKNTAAHSA